MAWGWGAKSIFGNQGRVLINGESVTTTCLMSALSHFADSSRTFREVRECHNRNHAVQHGFVPQLPRRRAAEGSTGRRHQPTTAATSTMNATETTPTTSTIKIKSRIAG